MEQQVQNPTENRTDLTQGCSALSCTVTTAVRQNNWKVTINIFIKRKRCQQIDTAQFICLIRLTMYVLLMTTQMVSVVAKVTLCFASVLH